MKIRFLQKFNYRITPRTTIAYKAGWEGLVRPTIAEAAIAQGKAEEIREPRKRSSASDAVRKPNRGDGRLRKHNERLD